VNLLRYLAACSALGASSRCASPTRPPRKDSETLAPTRSWDLALCTRKTAPVAMGRNGRGGAAIALADPVYLAVADDVAIRKVYASGVRGTSDCRAASHRVVAAC